MEPPQKLRGAAQHPCSAGIKTGDPLQEQPTSKCCVIKKQVYLSQVKHCFDRDGFILVRGLFDKQVSHNFRELNSCSVTNIVYQNKKTQQFLSFSKSLQFSIIIHDKKRLRNVYDFFETERYRRNSHGSELTEVSRKSCNFLMLGRKVIQFPLIRTCQTFFLRFLQCYTVSPTFLQDFHRPQQHYQQAISVLQEVMNQ